MDKPIKPVVIVVAAVAAVGAIFVAIIGAGVALYYTRPRPADPPPAPAAAPAPDREPLAKLPLPPAGPIKPPPAPPPPPRADGFDASQVIDGVSVRVAGAVIDQTEDEMAVVVVIETSDPNRKYTSSSWEPRGAEDPSRLADDAGNVYRAKPLNVQRTVAVRAKVRERFGERLDYGPGQVYSGKPRMDSVVFERPVDGCKALDLDLDGRQLGIDGTFRFRLPRGQIEGVGRGVAAKPPAGPPVEPAPPAPVEKAPAAKPEEPKPAEAFKEGDRVTLTSASKSVAVGKTKPALEGYRKAEAAGDKDEMARLVSEGKVFAADDGTDAKVLGTDEGLYWVKIATGTHRDKLGYVAAADVGRPGGKK